MGPHTSSRRPVALLLAVAAALALAAPGTCVAGISGIPGAFADIGIGARSLAMGGSVAAVRGAEALFWNPARIDPGDAAVDVSLSYCDQMGLVPYSAAAGATRVGPYAVGAGVLYSGDDVLTETTVLIGGARTMPELPWACGRRPEVGAALRVRRASFGNNESHDGQVSGTALGFALDVGATVPVPGDATVAVVWRDAVSSLSWDSSVGGTYDEAVPSVVSIGAAVTAAGRLTVEAGFDMALEDGARDFASMGVELALFDVAALRGGYRTSVTDDTLDEFTAGGGVSTSLGSATVGVDVAYVFSELEDTLRMAVGIAWR